MDLAEVHKLSDKGPIGKMDLEKMDILEDLEGTADGKIFGGLSQLVGNKDILGLETVPEKFLGEGVDEAGQGEICYQVFPISWSLDLNFFQSVARNS